MKFLWYTPTWAAAHAWFWREWVAWSLCVLTFDLLFGRQCANVFVCVHSTVCVNKTFLIKLLQCGFAGDYWAAKIKLQVSYLSSVAKIWRRTWHTRAHMHTYMAKGTFLLYAASQQRVCRCIVLSPCQNAARPSHVKIINENWANFYRMCSCVGRSCPALSNHCPAQTVGSCVFAC